MIQPTYVSFEQAKKLKEKRFDVHCTIAYVEERIIDPKTGGDNFTGVYRLVTRSRFHKRYYLAPEQWQVVEWLRVNHGIWVYSLPIDNEMKLWQSRIIKGQPFSNLKNTLKIINNGKISYMGLYSPQEAYSAAFDYILNDLI